MMETLPIQIGYFLSGLYSFILIVIGTPLNILCFYAYTRLVPNRSNPTIIVLAYLALIELLVPFTWNINYVVRELMWKYQKNNSMKNLEQHSLFICKLISFGAYFSLQCAAWLKTLATFARCVSVHHEWKIKSWLSKPTVIRRAIWITILLIALINFPIWIINGERHFNLDNTKNQTEFEIKCYTSKFFNVWEIVHLLLYNFIPFTLMILCNIGIIRHVHASRNRTQRSKSKGRSSQTHRPKFGEGSRLTKTLMLITILFIVFTSPAAIFYIFFAKRITKHKNLISMSLSNLATTSHVSSFIIYWLSSADFKNAVINLICCRPINPQRISLEENKNGRVTSERSRLSTRLQSIDENQRKLPTNQSDGTMK